MKSKNATRKARRYRQPVQRYAIAENRAYSELKEGSGVVTVFGFGTIRCPDGTASQRKQEAKRQGKSWRIHCATV